MLHCNAKTKVEVEGDRGGREGGGDLTNPKKERSYSEGKKKITKVKGKKKKHSHMIRLRDPDTEKGFTSPQKTLGPGGGGLRGGGKKRKSSGCGKGQKLVKDFIPTGEGLPGSRGGGWLILPKRREKPEKQEKGQPTQTGVNLGIKGSLR